MKNLLPLMLEMRDAVSAASALARDDCPGWEVRWSVQGSGPEFPAAVSLELWRDDVLMFQRRFTEGQIRFWLADPAAPQKLIDAIRFLVRDIAD